MSKIGFIIICAVLTGGVCLLLALGHAVITFLCRVCRPFEEWAEEGIEAIEQMEDIDEWDD